MTNLLIETGDQPHCQGLSQDLETPNPKIGNPKILGYSFS